MSSIESKRVQYRKYLERAGVIDALSKALIKLYEEQNKPDDAIRFVRKFMCETCPDDDQFDTMRSDLESANKNISKLEQELERLRSQIKRSPEEIREDLENGMKALLEDEENTESLLKKYLSPELLEEYVETLTPAPVEASLLDCIQAGFEHHNAKVGVYAADVSSYDVFNKLFDPIIKDQHGMLEMEEGEGEAPAPDAVLQKDTDWGNADEIENLDPEKKYIQTCRIRVARSLVDFPLFPKLREKQYTEIEDKVRAAAEALDGEHAGGYYPLGEMDTETHLELAARNTAFKRGNEELQTAGCYRFWPLGRGVFYNPAESFIIWVNSKDHVRVISVAKCGDLGDVYNRLVTGLETLEKNMQFVRHERYGFITASPIDLGTALRASVHIRLPLLAQDEEKLKAMADELNLDIRGTHGVNSTIEDGLMEVSNKQRMGPTEFELVKILQDGLVKLIATEEELEAAGA